MEVEVTAEALADIEEAANFYEAHRRGLGARFIDTVDKGLSRIAEMPQAFARLEDLPGEVRRFTLADFPFGIIYRIVEKEITVFVVADLRRKPGYWHKRK